MNGITRRLVEGYKPEKIILFGSSATGNRDAYSDIDLLIVKSTTEPFLRRLREVAPLCPDDADVDCFVYTPEELQIMLSQGNVFIQSALSTGKVIYERPRD